MPTITYCPEWLPLDPKDAGYKKFQKAEKILRRDPPLVGQLLLGKLDHVTIGQSTVSYFDCGCGTKTIDIIVNVDEETWHCRRGGQ